MSPTTSTVVRHARSNVTIPKQSTSNYLFPVSAPIAQVGIDLMGPLIPSTKKHRYVIVAIDYFTKWVEVKPLQLKDWDLVAQFFFDKIMMVHGRPIEIHTDNASKFCNALMDVLAIHMTLKHTTTTPYHPQCNGLTERFNRTLCSLIEKNGSYNSSCHTSLLAIVFAYRTSAHARRNFLLLNYCMAGNPGSQWLCKTTWSLSPN